eukprot:2664701-Rhodomonas_salina.4
MASLAAESATYLSNRLVCDLSSRWLPFNVVHRSAKDTRHKRRKNCFLSVGLALTSVKRRRSILQTIHWVRKFHGGHQRGCGRVQGQLPARNVVSGLSQREPDKDMLCSNMLSASFSNLVVELARILS